MAKEYSVETCRHLAEVFRRADLARPMRVDRYDDGDELTYDVTGVFPARKAKVTLAIDRFAGGGFAGQVYRVRIEQIDAPDGPIDGLEVGKLYAMKILRPPSRFSQAFRDAVYAVGFQAPFSLQVNPDAARAGALWQKFIRRAAAERFEDERSVVDIHATFIDETLGSCGELSEWVDGRTWRFEVDDRLQDRFQPTPPGREELSPEYQAKKRFMDDFVDLLHEVGAHEFARQYEWWTCKSQPNALKRKDTENNPRAGLTAVEFRAGLPLLPFLPMAPGDVPLIFKGMLRGSLVQFDRGNLKKLRAYTRAHPETFTGMDSAFAELVEADHNYRESMPDLTHHHVRLLYDRELWGSILRSCADSYRIRNLVDEPTHRQMRSSPLKALGFGAMGLLAPLSKVAGIVVVLAALARWAFTDARFTDTFTWGTVIIAAVLAGVLPKLVGIARAMWGRANLREHYASLVTSPGYFLRALRGRMAEKVITWHRGGRVSAEVARKIADGLWRMMIHTPLSVMPVFLHKMLTDRRYAKTWLTFMFVRPIRLYLNADAREQWLREMVADGLRRPMLTEEDAEIILSRVKEPFIQKYLKSLAVHVCTQPVTQVVSVIVAWVYASMHPEWTAAETAAAVAAVLVLFQVIPISPGSLVGGLYVLYLVIRERNFKDYNIAVFLGFFRYVGYLAFPIQMAYRYPALARFMAGHWATGAVHVVPVFGEHGALAEHAVFDLFYNYPLTVRRRLRVKAALRQDQPPRWMHLPTVVAAAGATLILADTIYWALTMSLPTMKSLWFFVWVPPLLAGMAAAALACGASTARRMVLGPLAGLGTAALYAISNTVILAVVAGVSPTTWEAWSGLLKSFGWTFLWTGLLFALVGAVGAFIAESREPRAKPRDLADAEHFVKTVEEDGGMPDRLKDEAPDKLRDDIRVNPRDEIIA
ncbi:MAG: hypothetical protein ACLFV7_13960 [Phycisphaerae bacterium]